MPTFKPEVLQSWVRALLEDVGAPPEPAAAIADQLLHAELTGRRSHGLNLLPDYVDEIRSGVIDVDAEPAVTMLGPTWCAVDGRRAPGAVVLDRTYAAVRPVAETAGLCLATIGRSGHIGHLSRFVERAAGDGFVAVLLSGSAADASDAVMAPVEARRPVIGTNPIAIGVATEDGPFVSDVSLSEVSWYEAQRCARLGAAVMPGSIYDSTGCPTDNPVEASLGGRLMPIGAHKGFALALGVALLCGLGGGAGSGAIGGTLALLIDPGRMGDGYATATAAALQALRATPTFDGRPLRLPGDGSIDARKNQTERIVVDDAIWGAITGLGAGPSPRGG